MLTKEVLNDSEESYRSPIRPLLYLFTLGIEYEDKQLTKT